MPRRTATRICAVLTPLVILCFTGCGADGEIQGTWVGYTPGENIKNVWSIKQVGGTWSVTCVYVADGKEIGAFHGEDVKVSGNVLTFRQVFDRKPVLGWLDNSLVTMRLNGKKLEFTWQNNGMSGTGTLERD